MGSVAHSVHSAATANALAVGVTLVSAPPHSAAVRTLTPGEQKCTVIQFGLASCSRKLVNSLWCEETGLKSASVKLRLNGLNMFQTYQKSKKSLKLQLHLVIL